MTNPNLVNTASVYMKTAVANLGFFGTTLVTNPANSNNIIRIDTFIVCNPTASPISVTAFAPRSPSRIASTVEVPAYSTLVIVDKDYPVYLNEGDTLSAEGSGLQAVCSYTVISDTSISPPSSTNTISFGTPVTDVRLTTTTDSLTAAAESGADLYLAFRSSDSFVSDGTDTNYTVAFSDIDFNGTAYVEFSYNNGTDNNYTQTTSTSSSEVLTLLPVYNGSYTSHSVSAVNGQTPPAVSCNDGDVLLVVIFNQDIAPPVTVTPPSGYTLLSNEDNGGVSGNSAGVAIAYKNITSTGTETPGAWTINNVNAADVHYSMSIRLGSPEIVQNNLILFLDAADSNSYPGTGTTWFDLSGNGFHGTLTNGPVHNGTYFDFDGDNDYVEMGTIGTSHPLQLSSPSGGGITVMFAAWFDTGGDAYQRIADKSDGGSAANGWAIYPQSSTPNQGDIDFHAGVPGANATMGTTINPTPANTWAIWSFTWNQSTGSYEWKQNNSTVSSGTVSYSIANVQTNMRLGTWNHTDARELNGRIGFFMVYDRPLSPSELTNNFDILKGNYGL
jgi:hypothetical protein